MLKHVGNGSGNDFETRVLRDRRYGTDFRKSKIWYENEREEANLSTYRKKVGVLMRLAT